MSCLDGIWEFSFSSDGSPASEEVFFDAVAPVPGCADILHEYSGKWGTAFYRRSVLISGQVKLSLTAGLHSEIYWDGRKIGASVLPWTREDWIFDAGDEKDHELLIRTDNIPDESDSSVFHSCYDFYGYCGIYDSVEIEKLRQDVPERIEVIPLDYTDGTICLRTCFPDSPPAVLHYAFDGHPEQTISFAPEITLHVPDFRLWSPENPHLHKLTVNGRTVSFGLRVITWQNGRLQLNGKDLKLVGYCRHESHPEFGPSTPPALIWADLLSIKKQGCNFIRGSHYPQKELMLDYADRLGLLIWEEALGWGNTEKQLSSDLFCSRQEEQCIKMVRKSINHPSVILWGFLNECASHTQAGYDLVKRLAKTIHNLDFSRPVTFASNHVRNDLCTNLIDVIAYNIYPDWYDLNLQPEGFNSTRRALKNLSRIHPGKPLIISEIGCSALYGDHSGYRWSEEYQAKYLSLILRTVLRSERITGISIWQFCDSRSCHSTTLSNSRPRGFNNKGVLDEYRRPKLAWKTLKAILKKKALSE